MTGINDLVTGVADLSAKVETYSDELHSVNARLANAERKVRLDRILLWVTIFSLLLDFTLTGLVFYQQHRQNTVNAQLSQQHASQLCFNARTQAVIRIQVREQHQISVAEKTKANGAAKEAVGTRLIATATTQSQVAKGLHLFEKGSNQFSVGANAFASATSNASNQLNSVLARYHCTVVPPDYPKPTVSSGGK